MFWALFILAVVIVLLLAFHYSFSAQERLRKKVNKRIGTIRSKLKIAEKRHSKREIPDNIFETLQDEFQSELASQELLLVRLEAERAMPLEKNVDAFLSSETRPVKRIRAEAKPLVKEISSLEKELKFLEKRLLKRKIKESVFERLSKEKHLELIQKEVELFQLLRDSEKKCAKKE